VATFHKDRAEIQEKMHGILGQKAWGVALGQLQVPQSGPQNAECSGLSQLSSRKEYTHKSKISSGFGQWSSATRPQQSPMELLHGEWHLVIWCAWCLEQEAHYAA